MEFIGQLMIYAFILMPRCYSYVGRIDGRQSLSIGDSCEYKGIIVHELLHALGRWHEHNRPDRDQYIQIHSENIRNGKVFSEIVHFGNTNAV